MIIQSHPFPGGLASGDTFIGSGVGGYLGTGGTYNFTSLRDSSDAQPTLAEGDIVLAYIARSDSASLCVPSGYTPIASNSGTWSAALSYKVMGSTPDTSLTVPSEGSSIGSAVLIVHVFRGIDPTSPVDVFSGAATGSSAPNGPSITPNYENALIYVAGSVGDDGSGVSSLTKPANLDSTNNYFRAGFQSYSGSLIETAAAAGIYRDWESGAFDPDAFGGGGSFNYAYAVSVALRIYGPSIFTPSIALTSPLSISIAGNPVGSVTAYQWRRNGVNISGATSSTYEIQEADFGTSITCRVTMTNGPYTASKVTAARTVTGGDLTQENGDAILLEGGADRLLWFGVS